MGGSCSGREIRRLSTSPSTTPWTRPAAHRGQRAAKTSPRIRGAVVAEEQFPLQLNVMGARLSRAAPGKERPSTASVLFLACFLACALASQRCFHPLFFAGLQVKGVALDLLDNVFLLHLALEATQSVLERFALLMSNFRQTDTPPDSSGRTG